MNSTLCVGPHDEDTHREALQPLRVCKHCHDRVRSALRDTPQWWADLADTNRGQRPRQGGRNADRAEPISEDARGIRAAIHTSLITWCLILRDDHHITTPDEDTIVGFTHRLILQLQEARAQALTDHDRTRADRYTHDLADVRTARASGADIIGGLCEHLDRHTAWLLTSEHADLYAHQIPNNAWHACRIAHPSRPDALVTCPCGTSVALNADQLRITCTGCGEWGDLGWWWDRVVTDQPRPLKITELSRWLKIHKDLDVTTKQLRNWRDRHLLIALPIDKDPAIGSAQRFDPIAVAIVAENRLGETVRMSA